MHANLKHLQEQAHEGAGLHGSRASGSAEREETNGEPCGNLAVAAEKAADVVQLHRVPDKSSQ